MAPPMVMMEDAEGVTTVRGRYHLCARMVFFSAWVVGVASWKMSGGTERRGGCVEGRRIGQTRDGRFWGPNIGKAFIHAVCGDVFAVGMERKGSFYCEGRWCFHFGMFLSQCWRADSGKGWESSQEPSTPNESTLWMGIHVTFSPALDWANAVYAAASTPAYLPYIPIELVSFM
ncbi:hypothetical protein VTK56DRAFT_8038 [Thermocarpiscus australiensis]